MADEDVQFAEPKLAEAYAWDRLLRFAAMGEQGRVARFRHDLDSMGATDDLLSFADRASKEDVAADELADLYERYVPEEFDPEEYRRSLAPSVGVSGADADRRLRKLFGNRENAPEVSEQELLVEAGKAHPSPVTAPPRLPIIDQERAAEHRAKVDAQRAKRDES